MFITSCAGYNHSGFREIIKSIVFLKYALKMDLVKGEWFDLYSNPLFKLNDCISVSTISCGFDSIKSTIFIHIIQAIFFYQKYLGQKLVTLLC